LVDIALLTVMFVQGKVDMGSVSISTVPRSESLLVEVWGALVGTGTHPPFGENLGEKAWRRALIQHFQG
jgi:hypothetical protein